MDASSALRGLISLGFVAAAASCAVDDRQLRALGSSGAGSTAGASALAGGAGDDSVARPPLPDCDYSAGVLDGCETLVANPGFTQGTEGWKAEDATVVMSWN